MKKLAVLISNAGMGSNLQAIIDAIRTQKLHVAISVVVSDTADAYGLIRAKEAKIPIYILQKGEDLKKILIKTFPINFVVLAGWKKIIPIDFIESFENRIINIHPGLIPDTIQGTVLNPDKTKALWNKGKFTTKALQEFLDKKTTYAGSTIHFLSKEFDFGKVLGRAFEKIKKSDTVESLYKRLKKKENILLVDVLKNL
jgi:phosphoribosylglycinamide formyltransferase-1